MQGIAFAEVAAIEAHDLIESAVQVNDGCAAGTLVEAVDVLRRDQIDLIVGLPRCEPGVDRARLRTRETRPTGCGAKPVTLPRLGRLDEETVLHRLGVLPVAPGIAVGRQSRCDADTGTGQNQWCVLGKKMPQPIGCGVWIGHPFTGWTDAAGVEHPRCARGGQPWVPVISFASSPITSIMRG